jgi:hypothetical protein
MGRVAVLKEKTMKKTPGREWFERDLAVLVRRGKEGSGVFVFSCAHHTARRDAFSSWHTMRLLPNLTSVKTEDSQPLLFLDLLKTDNLQYRELGGIYGYRPTETPAPYPTQGDLALWQSTDSWKTWHEKHVLVRHTDMGHGFVGLNLVRQTPTMEKAYSGRGPMILFQEAFSMSYGRELRGPDGSTFSDMQLRFNRKIYALDGKHQFVTRFSQIDVDGLHHADKLDIGNFRPQLFANFADDGVAAGFAKVDAAPQRSGEPDALHRVISFVDEDAIASAK